MPTSQLKFYSSSDASAPALSGTANSLITVLDAILVNGYGAKAAVGWTKPIANAGNCGCYKQSVGAGCTLFVNDNGPNVTSTFKEAWITGWESLASIAAPVGTGGGQFPLPSQVLTTGHLVARKSTTADATARTWSCFADAYTFYFFCSESGAALNEGIFFGDLYSTKTGVPDVGRCMIVGNVTENSTNTYWDSGTNGPSGVAAGHYASRTWGGGGGSVNIGALGDTAWNGQNSNFTGSVPCPNGPDNSILLAPIKATEPTCYRGRFRGLYHIAHSTTASFSEGQVFTGTGDFSGKTFQCTSTGTSQARIAIEISATVETN